MSLESLARLQAGGWLRPVDLEFARLLAGYAQADPDAVALVAALLSVELGRGHVCLELGALDGQPFAGIAAEGAPRIDAARLAAALRGEPGVCAAHGEAEPRPLVLDGDRVYLHRYWRSEQRVAARLLALARTPVALGEDTAALLHALYPDPSAGNAGQKLACAMALTRALGVISGGPGTGKTSTVARLLLLLACEARGNGKRLAIKLAAPTGKAAARVGESLARELENLQRSGVDTGGLLHQIPTEAQTLHRLLGAGGRRGFAHDASNPLAADVVVLDESSMVDLRLLDALLGALPPRARLVLLGDRDQLAAVEAGNVFGALCARAGALSAARARELQPLAGPQPAGAAQADAVTDTIAVLRHSYRFAAGGGIGRLAAAVNAADAEAVNATLRESHPELGVAAYPAGLEHAHHARMRDGYRGLVDAVRDGAAPAELIGLQERFRVLCAVRDGEFGVGGLNRAIEGALMDAGLVDRGQTFYAGRPLIVTRNDHGLRLYNGDTGVVVCDEDGHPRALFAQAGGGARSVPVARLPAHETAYALTVHKSQGSEFDTVLLVVPPVGAAGDSLAGRELLYTGITRARRRLELLLPATGLDARWLRASETRSGLADRLG